MTVDAAALVPLADLLAQRQPAPSGSGVVYFLFQGDELVYVGQSIELAVRLRQHQRERVIRFDSYVALDVELGRLDRCALEAAYIKAYGPRLNAKVAPRYMGPIVLDWLPPPRPPQRHRSGSPVDPETRTLQPGPSSTSSPTHPGKTTDPK